MYCLTSRIRWELQNWIQPVAASARLPVIAIDGSSQVWVTNNNGATVSLFANNGTRAFAVERLYRFVAVNAKRDCD